MDKKLFHLPAYLQRLAAIAVLLSVTVSVAAADIDWQGTSYTQLISPDKDDFQVTSEKVFYLYNVGQKKFVNVGASYDAEPILSNVGIKMICAYCTDSSDPKVFIRTSINNSGDRYYLGLKGDIGNTNVPSRLLCDLSPEIDETTIRGYQCGWYFVPTGNGNRLRIRNSKNVNTTSGDENMCYNPETGRLETSNTADENAEWLLITLNEYETKIKALREGEIEVTAYITDSRFSRNNLWVSAWKWDNTDGTQHQIGEPEDLVYGSTTYTGYGFPGGVGYQDEARNGITVNYYSQFNVAEVKAGEANRLCQTIKGLPAGSYRLTCQAFYDDGNSGTSKDASCYIFANDQHTTLKPVTQAVLNGVTVPTAEDAKTTYNVGTETPVLSPYTYTHSTSGFSQTYCTTTTKDGKTVPSDGMAAAMFFNYNEKICVNEVYVNLRDGEDLVIGFNKGNAAGWVAADNFRLYYLGRYEYVIDEDALPSQAVNDDLYDANINFRRTMGNNWTSIVLPFNVTRAQFEKTFGQDAIVSELVGIDPDDDHRILFNEVTKGAEDDVYMQAGTHYIIYGAGSPQYDENEKYSFVINNNETLTTTVKGPVYQFSNINRRSEDPQPTLFNLVMHSSHHAFDRSKIHHQVHTTRDKSPVVALNEKYGRNEAQFTSTWGGTAQKGFYKIDYKDNNTFKDAVKTAHSIAVLVKVENTGNSEAEADIVSSFGAQNGGFGIVVNKGKLQYHIYTGGEWKYIDSGVTPEADKYYYVVGTWSTDGTANIYVDGVLKATRTDAGTSLTLPSETEQCIGIGGSITETGIQRAFNGAVVIARLYDVALTEEQIKTLYAKLTPIKDEPMIYTTTSGGKERHLKFIGTYGYEADKKAPKGSYFVSDGKMYHLTSDIPLYGFRGYIVETDAQGNPLDASQTQTLSLRVKSADGTLTDIDPVVAETRAPAAQCIYNINGQVVRRGTTSTAGLPKGMYIIGGRKVTVR